MEYYRLPTSNHSHQDPSGFANTPLDARDEMNPNPNAKLLYLIDS
jgi:hypothetical protein